MRRQDQFALSDGLDTARVNEGSTRGIDPFGLSNAQLEVSEKYYGASWLVATKRS